MRDLRHVTPAEIEPAALRAVEEENGRIEGYLADDRVAALLGGSVDDLRSMGVSPAFRWEFAAAQRKWSGRVRRVMDKLADNGALVKVGKDQRTPGGTHATNTVFYYTPGAYQAEIRRAAEGTQRALEVQRRWEEVQRRLWDGPAIRLGSGGKLSLEDWEKLLIEGGW